MIRTPWKSQQSAPIKILPQCFHCLGESSFWGQIMFLQHPTDSAKTRAFCLKFKATISYFFLQPLLYITNWKVRASLLLTEDDRSDSHQCDQFVPCCCWEAPWGHALDKSGWANPTELQILKMLLSPTDTRSSPVHQSDEKREGVGMLGITAIRIYGK